MAQYVKTNWLERVGDGALKRTGTPNNICGALWALSQSTDNTHIPIPIRIGGRTALEYHGFGHNITFQANLFLLFGNPDQTLPKWFWHTTWDHKFTFVRTSCFPFVEQQEMTIQNCTVIVSSPEQAILEACYLAPKQQDLEELRNFMASLTSLRSHIVQRLLKDCTSIKAKRLFLFLAHQYQHPWIKDLDEQYIDLGTGKRHIVSGILDKRYNLTLPRDWFDDTEPF